MNHEDLTAKSAKGAKEELLFKDECYAIQGAIFEVYREMGCGFLEAVYQECLEKEFRLRQLPFEAQKELVLSYKGEQLAQTYKPDFHLLRQNHRRAQSGERDRCRT